MPILRELFYTPTMAKMLATPIGGDRGKDNIIWPHNPDYVFTVRDDYNVLSIEQRSQDGLTASTSFRLSEEF